ncbi:uridine kinase [Kineosporia sp. NBRC 101731]|uniref:uridine kinase n=1 Tax=Kineosporia sp. NBRC 101731 TaxID=3032199 RepID=UPI0024A41E7C|nr:uridine kinase [Kineosporia sp. NBRC 101731]GLY30635.1 adenylate kinase [Kineosporia sp. NBRC 101731]
MTSAPQPDPAVIDLLIGLLERAGAHSHPSATTVLAIDGPSGSGKTTLADELTRVLHQRKPGTAALVRLEDLYPGWDGLRAATGRLATEVLPALTRGETARYRRWDWTADRFGVIEDEVPAKEVTIVEGVGAGALAAAPMVHALVFADAPEQVRHARAMARDGEGYRPHWERWAAQERAYFADDHPHERADLLVLPGLPGSVQGRALR